MFPPNVRALYDPPGPTRSDARAGDTYAIRRALKSRDGGCVFPGCTARHFVEGHHVQHWAHGGGTRLDNLVQLCHFHHRLVHEGGFHVQADEADGFVFKRPDGRVVEPVPDSVSIQCADGAPIEAINRNCGLEIHANTGITLWDGTRMDSRMAIDALLSCDAALELGPGARYPEHFPP